jgi:hypothetical protein
MGKKGRPTKTPEDEERERVKQLSGFGLTQEQIALVMKMHIQTLRKHYSEELAAGKAEALELATKYLFTNIKKGKEPSIFFYLKCQHRWSEKAPEISDDTIDRIAAGVNRPREMGYEEWKEFADKQRAKSKQKASK